MTGEQWRDERMLEWLESGPFEVPPEPLDAAVAYARAHPRRRLSVDGLRRMAMSQMHLTEVKPPATHRSWAAIIAAAVVVVVVVVGGAALISRNNNDQSGGVAAPVASPTVPPTAPPTLAQTVAPSLTPPSAASACEVSTLAGKRGPGFADGAGAAARFGGEGVWLVFGPDGLICMPDRSNHVVRRMTIDGVVTTIAGKAGDGRSVDGKGADARFNSPTGGGFDAAGNFYVADTDAHTIRRIAPDGTVTTIAGKAGEAGTTDGKGSAARFTAPTVGAVDGSGNIYVGTTTESTIRKVAPDGTVTTLAGVAGDSRRVDGKAADARFYGPWFPVIDAQGVLWVIDINRNVPTSSIRTVAPDGMVTTVKEDWTYGPPFGLWIDPSGAAYYTSYANSTVAMLTPDGQEVLLAGNPDSKGDRDGPGDVARFNTPTGIARDASGLIYVSDSENGTIRTIMCP